MIKIIFIISILIFTNHLLSQDFSIGDKAWAYYSGDATWYEVTILEKIDATYYKIHWEGFSSDYDEKIQVSNLWRSGDPFIVNDKLQGMETDGKWYNVKVLKRDLTLNKYFIHWGGFESVYDRWISYDSLRLPTKNNYIEAGNFNTTSSTYQSYSSSSSSSSSSSVGKSFYYTLENKSSTVIKFESDNGGGARSVSSISPGNSTSIMGIPNGKLVINGTLYRTLTESDNGARIIYK